MNRLVVPTLLLAVVAGSVAPAVEWQTLGPTARCAARVAVDGFKQRAFLFGGTTVYANGVYFEDLWEMSLSNANQYAWRKVIASGTPPSGRADHVMVYNPTDGQIIVFGGSPQRYVHVDDVWVLNINQNTPTWQELHPTGGPPGGRGYAYGIYHPSRHSLIIFGGYSVNRTYDDVWELLLDNLVWRQVPVSGTRPSARFDGASLFDPSANRMIVFGGKNGGYNNEVWALSLTPGSESWSQLSPGGQSPEERAGFAYATTPDGQKLYVFGGWNSYDYYNDLYELNIPTLTWTSIGVTGELPQARRNTLGFMDAPNRSFFVFGGEAGPGGYLSDTHFTECVSLGTGEWCRATEIPDQLLAVTSIARDRVRIQFTPGATDRVDLRVVDAAGRCVRRLLSGASNSGSRVRYWDCRDNAGRPVRAGTYYCRMETGDLVVSRKFTVVR